MFEIAFAAVSAAALLAAAVYVQLHTRSILRMLARHQQELAAGEQRLQTLLAQLRATHAEPAPGATTSAPGHSGPSRPEIGAQSPNYPAYLPPPCPDCETETIHTLGGPIRHIVTNPCDAHKEL